MKGNRLAARQGPAAWLTEPLWYLWDGGFLLLARSEGIVKAHKHHAIQVVIALDGEPALRTEGGDWQSARGLIVKPDITHSFDGRGAENAMLFVDPESLEGAWLRTSLEQPITLVSDARIRDCTAGIRCLRDHSREGTDLHLLIRQCVHALCDGAPPLRRQDARISRAIRTITGSENLRFTQEEIAATVFLSPSRFAHLFVQQVGLPFRRYLLWRKLARAMLAIGQGNTMTEAAQAADFADAAHLTRTFNSMFGIAPSALMRGRFREIGSPFDARS